MPNKYSKYRNTGRQRHHACPHMVYTEALDLDEALDIMINRKAYRSRSRAHNQTFADHELAPKKPVTLPKLKWLENKSDA